MALIFSDKLKAYIKEFFYSQGHSQSQSQAEELAFYRALLTATESSKQALVDELTQIIDEVKTRSDTTIFSQRLKNYIKDSFQNETKELTFYKLLFQSMESSQHAAVNELTEIIQDLEKRADSSQRMFGIG